MSAPGARGSVFSVSQPPASGTAGRLGSVDSVLGSFSREVAKVGRVRSLLKLLQKILKTSDKETEQSADVHSLVPCGDVVPRRQEDERNRIILELVGFQGPKDFPRLLGSATVHLYEVIKVFCTAEVEFMFCYGSFGYGYSHQ